MRDFRRQFDARRAAFYRQYIGQRDVRFFPDNVTPRSNSFMMYPQSNVETVVSRTLDAFFSFDPWFECKGRGRMDEPAAEKMQLVLSKKLRDADLYAAMQGLVKNIAIYGFGGIKVDWDWESDIVNYAEPILMPDPMNPAMPMLDPATGKPLVLGIKPASKAVPRMRPKFTSIDIYDLLVDPDGRYCAHLTERTFGQLRREAAAKPDMYVPGSIEQLGNRLAADKDPDSIVVRLAELWDDTNNTVTVMTFGEDAEAVSWKDLRYSYRNTGYSTYKRRMYGGPAILLWQGENQFAHKRNPILYTSYMKLPNEIYGLGVIEPIADLTESMNKFVNMIADNWNLGINKRYAYDVNADIDHAALNRFNVPGGKVGVSGDPNKVIMPLPSFTPAAGDYEILGLYKGMIEMTSGISDFYQKGVGSSGGNDTATGINQVINESNFKFRMFIRNLEVDILQPLLQMCASMVQQYTTDEIEIQITDDMPVIPKSPFVAPEELIGTFSFDLVAANYATNKVVKQRNLLALANTVGASPFVDQYELVRELVKNFEVRNPKIMKDPQQVMLEQQAALQQQVQMMVLESMLQTEGKARLQQSKPQMSGGGKEGRPRKPMMPEGKMPGAGLTNEIRELAQSMGVNGLGLGGTEDGGGGGS